MATTRNIIIFLICLVVFLSLASLIADAAQLLTIEKRKDIGGKVLKTFNFTPVPQAGISGGDYYETPLVDLDGMLYTKYEYAQIRVQAASYIKNKQKMTPEQAKVWILIANKEISKCQFKNATQDSLLAQINACIEGL